MRNCLISAVGRNSTHKQWTHGFCNFDLHLIVYDDSQNMYHNDAKFVSCMKGYKMQIIYKYIMQHPEYLDSYDYFFFPDDDISASSNEINQLFDLMEKYKIEIGQPSLRMSYYSWKHTLQNRYCILRYTNCIEMMIPCFSNSALRKVLFTFNENTTGWGIEAHWPLLLKTNHKDMAVFDQISVVHTRPVQANRSKHRQDMIDYLSKYNLRFNVEEYGCITKKDSDIFLLDRRLFDKFTNILSRWIENETVASIYMGENGIWGYIHFYFLFSYITQSQKYADIGLQLLIDNHKYLSLIKNDKSFGTGIIGCCWLVRFLDEQKLISDSADIILEDIDKYIDAYISNNTENLDIRELAGIIKYYKIINESSSKLCFAIPITVLERLFLDKIQKLKLLDLPYEAKCTLPLIKESNERFQTEWEYLVFTSPCTDIANIYLLFLIYVSNPQRKYKEKIINCLRKLPSHLMTITDALRLCELLSYKLNHSNV